MRRRAEFDKVVVLRYLPERSVKLNRVFLSSEKKLTKTFDEES
jgi:hypothetical protein